MSLFSIQSVLSQVFRLADGSINTALKSAQSVLNMVLTTDSEGNKALAVRVDGLEEGYVTIDTEQNIEAKKDFKAGLDADNINESNEGAGVIINESKLIDNVFFIDKDGVYTIQKDSNGHLAVNTLGEKNIYFRVNDTTIFEISSSGAKTRSGYIFQADTISEATGDAGVIIDNNVLIKDGGIYGNSIFQTLGSYFESRRDNIGAANANGIQAKNMSNASASVPSQYSPNIRLVGSGYDTPTATSKQADVIITNKPISGDTVKGKCVFSFQVDGGGYVDKFFIDSAGDISAGENTDAKATFGRASAGYNGENTGTACFAHQSWLTEDDSALKQQLTGKTTVQAGNNNYLEFRRGGDIEAYFFGGKFFVSGNTGLGVFPSTEKLEVDGAIKSVIESSDDFDGNIAVSLGRDNTDFGVIAVAIEADSAYGEFTIYGGNIVKEKDPASLFSTTKDNASTYNVYFESNTLYIQNKIADDKDFTASFIGILT